MQADGQVGAALVSMYAKCGNICDAQRVFSSLAGRGIEAWNALISGYAHQGGSPTVFDLLVSMVSEGIHPDKITLLSVLTVCSHVGLVDKGREHFDAMTKDYGIVATMEHYICSVNPLGRAGKLHEALEIAKNMPFHPNTGLRHTLLGACWKWKNVEIGQLAFHGAVSVDKDDATADVLMSNIHANIQLLPANKEGHAGA